MNDASSYDVIIIGSGAGGGTSAAIIYPRDKENWNPRLVNLESRYQTNEHWKYRDGNGLHYLLVESLHQFHCYMATIFWLNAPRAAEAAQSAEQQSALIGELV
jgi:hypothetical protein